MKRILPTNSKNKIQDNSFIILLICVCCLMGVTQQLVIRSQRDLEQKTISSKDFPCAYKMNITYIWLGQAIPSKYQQFIQRCKDHMILLGNDDLIKYVKMWNQTEPKWKIRLDNQPVNVNATILRKLYLYFEGGAYSDFDTAINETCFERIFTDKIIFTNTWMQGSKAIPEQNFIMVRRKFHPVLKRWLILEIHQLRNNNNRINRWDECRTQQCFYLQCQNHYYDRSWVK